MPETFGRYDLLACIGKGGMAEIYRARLQVPAGAEKILVIKRILSRFSADPEFLRLFVNEAKIALPLTHGNITSVFDFGEIDGQYYLAMEYIHGQNLAEVLTRAREVMVPIPIEAALFIAAEIAKGLAYAHGYTSPAGERVEVAHLDVSPPNVLVSYDGAVKLTDFGIAKVRFSATAAAVVRGKASYLAPETLSGGAVDGRADIFSLGCILYEMLTLRRPFQGHSDDETLANVRTGQVALPSEIHPELQPLDDLVMRAIAPEPEQRYARATDFQVPLTQALFARNPSYGSHELSAWMREMFGWDILEEQRAGGKSGAHDRLLYELSRAQLEIELSGPTKELVQLRTMSIPAPEPPELPPARRALRGIGAAVGAVVAIGLVMLLIFGAHSLGDVSLVPGGRPITIEGKEGGGRGHASVSLNSWPSAVVYLDGERLPGSTPILKYRVPAGTHRLMFEHRELQLRKEVLLELLPDSDRTVAVTLER